MRTAVLAFGGSFTGLGQGDNLSLRLIIERRPSINQPSEIGFKRTVSCTDCAGFRSGIVAVKRGNRHHQPVTGIADSPGF